MNGDPAPPIHALLIGVDRYLRPATGPDGSFPDLRGAVRDVERVERWLVEERGVSPRHIEKLLAPVSRREDAASSPTYENMVAAFRRLRRRAGAGEHVWIHYSGHGGRVPTLSGGKPQGVDEALVPTDVGDPQGRYLRDVELAYLLEELADAGIVMTVVLDCCHSGGAFRRGPSSSRRCRGTDRVDHTPRSATSLVASPEELRAAWRRVRRNPRRRLTMDERSRWRFEPQGYVLLAACRAHEQALEDDFDGEPGGALTHWLLESLRGLPREVTYREVYDRVRTEIRRQLPGQTPQLEGPGRWLVLGSEKTALLPAVAVADVDRAAGRLLLDAGEAHGVRRGSRFAVYPPGWKDFDDRDGRAAVVELVEVGASSSSAVPLAGQLDRIEVGAPSVLVALGPRSERRNRSRAVRLATGSSTETEALDRIARAIRDDGYLEVLGADAPADDEAHFEVAATRRGYEIRDAAGQPLAGVDPIPLSRPRAERFAAWCLVHLSRFHDVLEIANDATSPLRDALELELYRLPARPQGAVEASHLVPLPHPPEVRPGDWVCLRLRNLSGVVLNVTVLDLQFADWRIEQIFPDQASFRPFEPDEEVLLPFELLSSGGVAAPEVVKAIGTVEPTSFRWLQLPPIGGSGSRSFRPLGYAAMDWTVRDLLVQPACGAP